MEFSKIKFLLIKMIDILNKLSCIAYKMQGHKHGVMRMGKGYVSTLEIID